jgi:D-aspartate ligase
MNKHAVILGAGENGLGAVRSLKRANVPTILVAFNQRDPALLSRYPKRKVLVRCNENLDEPLLAQLETIRYEHPVLIPTADVFVSFIVRHRTRLNSRFCFCLPHDGLIESLLDKSREVKLISDQGVSIPNTFVDLSQHTPSRVQELGFPMIVKPKSWVEVQELGAKNAIIHSQKELISFLGRHSSILPGLLAQEIIPGDDSNQWVCNCTFGRNHELACVITLIPHAASIMCTKLIYLLADMNWQIVITGNRTTSCICRCIMICIHASRMASHYIPSCDTI